MKRIKIFFIAFATVFVSCKKEKLPELVINSPILSFSGNINGQAISINAGINDYYYFTTKTTNSDGVSIYSSELRQTTCSTCANALKISFTDYKIGNTQTDSTFYIGNYNFATEIGKPSRFNVLFTKTTIGQSFTGINWDFGDGLISNELNPIHTFTRPGKYTTCLQADFNEICSSSLCNSISLGNIGDFIETSLNVGNSVGNTINFSSNAELGTPPYSYFWNFGDGNSSSEQNFSYTYLNEGVYQVSLTITDALGISEVKNQNVRTENSTECVARYNYAINPILNPLNLGNIVIEWKDSNGILYTSKNNNQSIRSYFKINAIEEYILNETGNKTKKINVTFSCTLFNGSNQIEIKNATAILAVAY
jgi:PKD repeat protein